MLPLSSWFRTGTLALLCLGALSTAPAQAQRAAGPGRPADFLDPSFHRGRREALRQLLPAGAVAVVFAAPVRNRANDVNFIFHQNPDLYYLTGYDEPDGLLVLFKEPQTVGGQSGVTEMLFVQARDPQREVWTGRRLGAEGARQQLKVQVVAEGPALATANIPWSKFSQVLLPELPTDVRDDADNPADLYSLLATFRQQAQVPADYNPRLSEVHRLIQRYAVANGDNLQPYISRLASTQPAIGADAYVQSFLKANTKAAREKVVAARPASRFDGGTLGDALDELREVKTPEEIRLLRQAVRISAVGQQEVMKALRPDMGEMEVQGLHEYVYKKYGAEFEGYPSIVGAGANGCILHYETNDKPRIGTDLILMDCGAEYHGYTADVTRTVPPSGKFSPEQRQIYELVLAAQEAGFQACKPGAPFQAPHQAADKVITEGLKKLGLAKTDADVRRYFPHGTSHYLGLDVHDRGRYGPLAAGNVITVEPGIYIPEGSPCDKKWWNIGVRIEDDVLITPTGWENLSREAPRTVAEVEAMMAQPSALDSYKLPELR